MIRFLLAALLLFTTTPALAENPYLNLDFEDGQPGNSPRSWFAGGEGYTGKLTTDNPQNGAQCLQLTKTESSERGFGVATSTFPFAATAGETIRFTGWIRTNGVTEGYAGLWWRADGPDRATLAFDNMNSRGVTGDTEWAQYTIELNIPADVLNINFGCILPGNGTAWFDDLQVEIGGETYTQVRPDPFLATKEQVAWIADTAYRFATDDPAHGNEDLEFMKDLVGDAHIVSLGEGTHGTAEFFRMKHRLTRYLVEEMGFTQFGIEATMPEAELINRYVLTGEGDPAELIAGMYFWTWRTEEVLALVQWMRQHNEQGGHIEFRGFDMQYTGMAMKTVLDFMKPNLPVTYLDAFTTYAELRALIKASRGKGNGRPQIPASYNDILVGITQSLNDQREKLIQTHPAKEVDWVIQNAGLIAQYSQMNTGKSGGRDLFMADNADWLLEQAGPGAKIVLWAHNGHVARGSSGRGKMMGTHLAERHGRDMVVLGFAFHEGTYTATKRGEGLGAWGTSPSRPGTAEWAFHQTGQPRLVLDLRTAVPGSAESGWVSELVDMRSIGSMAIPDAFRQVNLAESYDALIYFETSTPSVLLDVQPPSEWAMWE